MMNVNKMKSVSLLFSALVFITLWRLDIRVSDGILFHGVKPFQFGTTTSYTVSGVLCKVIVFAVFATGMMILSSVSKKNTGILQNAKKAFLISCILDAVMLLLIIAVGAWTSGEIYEVNNAGQAIYKCSYWVEFLPIMMILLLQGILNLVWSRRMQ